MKHTNSIVKVLYDDDGDKIDNPKRHYADFSSDPMVLCTGEFYGEGQSRVIYKTSKGKINCEECIRKIKEYQSITL